MAAKSEAPAAAAGQILSIERIFDAPPSVVFAAWTEREHLMRWSAPIGFTITHCEGDPRPGGKWRSCMRSPDGADLWLGGVYLEVIKDKKLVFTHTWDGKDGKPGPETLVTVTFADLGAKTKMTFEQSGFKSTAARDGHAGGWSQSFDRLADYTRDLRVS